MKKILSIILALTLIIGLVPTAFAEGGVATEAESETYNFTTTGHSSPSSNTRLEATGGGKQQTALNEDSTKGGAWAYLGTTTNSLRSSSDSYRIVYIGESHATFILDADTYIAFKIQVPTSGTYEVEDFKPYLVKNSTATDMKMYIVPMTQELETKLNATTGTAWGDNKGTARTGELTFNQLGITASPLGTYSAASSTAGVAPVDVSGFDTVTMEANTDYAFILYSATGGSTGISSLTLTEVLPEPSASLTAASYETYDEGTIALTGKLIAADGETDITAQASSVKFESNDTNVAKVDDNGVVTGVAEGTAMVTVTYTYNDEEYHATVSVTVREVNKTHTYTLNATQMTADAIEKATTAGKYDSKDVTLTDMSYADEYNEIITADWAYSDLGCKARLEKYRLRAYGKKEAYGTDDEGSRLVLKLKVFYSGNYDISAYIHRLPTGSEADVYMLPAESVTEITSAILKSVKPIGRLNNIAAVSTDKVTDQIGSAWLSEGDWYIVFDMNTDNANTDNGGQILWFRNIKLTESNDVATEETPAETTVENSTLAVTSNLDNVEITVGENSGTFLVNSGEAGRTVSISAPDMTEQGYTFVGWQRGVAEKSGETYAEADGTSKIIDLTQNDTIKIYTNTFLTAVYEKTESETSDDPKIKFWNQDKSYLGTIAKSKLSSLPEMTLIGHSFIGWFTAPGKELLLSDVITDTNAVAQYTEKSALDSENEYDKVRVNGADRTEKNYGEEVLCKDTNGIVTHWLRDGKVVSYDAEYKHYIWDGTNTYSSYAEIEKKPLVVLEDITVDGAYMIEYDGAGKEIVEVGILFGEEETNPVVGSTFDKYVSQRSTNHGQLAAKPANESYTVARGYMIYIDNGKTYVIYSE